MAAIEQGPDGCAVGYPLRHRRERGPGGRGLWGHRPLCDRRDRRGWQPRFDHKQSDRGRSGCGTSFSITSRASRDRASSRISEEAIGPIGLMGPIGPMTRSPAPAAPPRAPARQSPPFMQRRSSRALAQEAGAAHRLMAQHAVRAAERPGEPRARSSRRWRSPARPRCAARCMAPVSLVSSSRHSRRRSISCGQRGLAREVLALAIEAGGDHDPRPGGRSPRRRCATARRSAHGCAGRRRRSSPGIQRLAGPYSAPGTRPRRAGGRRRARGRGDRGAPADIGAGVTGHVEVMVDLWTHRAGAWDRGRWR